MSRFDSLGLLAIASLIAAGPMAPRLGTPRSHIRQSSDDSIDSDASRKKLLADALTKSVERIPSEVQLT